MLNSPDSVINVTCLFLSTNPLSSRPAQRPSPCLGLLLAQREPCAPRGGLLAAAPAARPAAEGGYRAEPPAPWGGTRRPGWAARSPRAVGARGGAQGLPADPPRRRVGRGPGAGGESPPYRAESLAPTRCSRLRGVGFHQPSGQAPPSKPCKILTGAN